MMVVWFVPFGFFISLAANESVLPGGGGGGGMPAGAFGTFDNSSSGGKQRKNVILQVLDFGKAQWEKMTKKAFPNGRAPPLALIGQHCITECA